MSHHEIFFFALTINRKIFKYPIVSLTHYAVYRSKKRFFYICLVTLKIELLICTLYDFIFYTAFLVNDIGKNFVKY